MASITAGSASNRSHHRRVLLTCSATVVCTQMYLTAMNVALPAIGEGLQATNAQLQWSLNIYALVLASILMVSGALGDHFGRKRFMIIGMLTFTFGNVLAASAPSAMVLIAARGFQGLGASMLPVISLAVINNVFTDPAERARAIGVWNALMSIGIALGPVLAGVLVSWIDWRAVFWVPIPLLALTLGAIIAFIPESSDRTGRRLDVPGQFFTAVMLAALTYDIISLGEGIFSQVEWVLLGIFVIAGIAFLIRELSARYPMLDLRYLRSVPFVGGLSVMQMSFMTYGGFLFVFVLYLQLDYGFTPFKAGLMMIPLAIANSVAAVVAGRLVAAVHVRAVLLAAAACNIAMGVAMLAVVQTGPFWLLLVAVALMGLIQGFTNLPVTNSVLATMPEGQSGVASAITSTARQIGISLGIAVFGAFMNLGVKYGEPIHTAAHPAWWISIALGIISAIFAVATTSKWARRSAARVRNRIKDDDSRG